MRLRKNLRIWAVLLVICLCLFAVTVGGGKFVPMLTKQTSKADEAVPTEAPAVDNANDVQASQNASMAQKLIEGYTSDVDQSVFESTAIIGNSFAEDIRLYGLITTADYYSKVGLNIKTVADFVVPETSLPIYEAIPKNKYKNIVFVFGQNEMDWNSKTFENLFQQMLTNVTASQPNARLFFCAVTPISKDISDRAVDGATMERVNLVNGSLAQLAINNGGVFVDSTALFAGADGYLAEGSSADGVHLEYKYSKAWANHLAKNIKNHNS